MGAVPYTWEPALLGGARLAEMAGGGLLREECECAWGWRNMVGVGVTLRAPLTQGTLSSWLHFPWITGK